MILPRVSTLLDKAREQGVFPGAAVAVGSSKDVHFLSTGVTTSLAGGQEVRSDTIYDVASLTKLFTATAALSLLEDGSLRLDDTVSSLLPSFHGDDKQEITVRHLLTHSSGLAAHAPLFLSATSSEEMVSLIAQTPLEFRPGSRVVYSCLGFIVLGHLLGHVSSLSLEQLLGQRVLKPLNMADTSYVTGKALPRERVAPTEECPWRGRLMWGEVHDENAYAQGGISGNAGLFSTVVDLAAFSQMILNGGQLAEERILSAQTINLSARNHTVGLNENRGLGWQLKSSRLSWCGDIAPEGTFGHTGFTGTSLLICRELDLFVVLLSNRVHPTRANDKHIRLRALLHNAVVSDWTNQA